MENLTNDFLQSANKQITEEEVNQRFTNAVKEMDASEDTLKELSNGLEDGEGVTRGATLTAAAASMSRAYSNSPLVSYTCYSPNHSGTRQHAIDTITIHEVWGECSMRALGDIFLPSSRQASSNYGVCTDGIALFVDEKNRAWTSGSWENDNRAITIETSNSRTYPNPVSDAVYQRLINLCADICKRNGKTKMVWCGSLGATNARKFAADEMRMTLHKWFQATDCPGAWLEQHMQDIANKVNAKLGLKEGWIKENNKWYYYENGKKATGWKKVDGKWYYLDQAGIMKTGWITKGKKKYYCGKNGVMLTGWQTIDGNKYYFKGGDSGEMLTGWQTLGGKTYYFGADGAMRKGWQTIGLKKYYFSGGVMQTGWFQGNSGKWYYFNKKGVYSQKVSEKFTPYWIVTTEELNVRESAYIKSKRVSILPEGTKVAIVYDKKGTKDEYTWGLLATHYLEKDGWIALKYTKKV